MPIARLVKHWVGEVLRGAVAFYYRKMGVSVGNKVFISLGAWIDVRRGTVVIEDGAAITNGCKVLSHDHTASRLGKPGGGEATTVIGKGAFLGMNVIVLPGVTVGANAIIGAGVVVSKDVPPGAVVVGGGMRIVRKLEPSTGKWVRAD